jgi:hypothetical protein
MIAAIGLPWSGVIGLEGRQAAQAIEERHASKKQSSPKSGFAARSFAVLASAWHDAREYFAETYRPELHYMRGPGPKWQAKHGQLDQTSDAAA